MATRHTSRRAAALGVRLTAVERAEIAEAARQIGQTPSGLLRAGGRELARRILGTVRGEIVETAAAVESRITATVTPPEPER